jgi:hypothetical protein
MQENPQENQNNDTSSNFNPDIYQKISINDQLENKFLDNDEVNNQFQDVAKLYQNNPIPNYNPNNNINYNNPNFNPNNPQNINSNFNPNIEENNMDFTETQEPDYTFSYNEIPADTVTEIKSENAESDKPKSSRLFYIITGVISAILLIIIIVLGYLIVTSNNRTNSQSQSSSSSLVSSSENVNSANSENQSSTSASIVNLFTDPQGVTPAKASKINDEQAISSQYLNKYFANNLSEDKTTCKDVNVCGSNIDQDKDGLNNLLEYNYQTDPTQPDTDLDGIADGDEINIYSSNPKEKDSDGDKVEDLKEVITCTDPALRTLSPFKINKEKRVQIENNARQFKIQSTTITSFTGSGASNDDLKTGLIAKNCVDSSVVILK